MEECVHWSVLSWLHFYVISVEGKKFANLILRAKKLMLFGVIYTCKV